MQQCRLAPSPTLLVRAVRQNVHTVLIPQHTQTGNRRCCLKTQHFAPTQLAKNGHVAMCVARHQKVPVFNFTHLCGDDTGRAALSQSCRSIQRMVHKHSFVQRPY